MSYLMMIRIIIDVALLFTHWTIQKYVSGSYGLAGFIPLILFNLVSVIFLGWNIQIWSVKDKKISSLFALLLLNYFYLPLYAHRILKNNLL